MCLEKSVSAAQILDNTYIALKTKVTILYIVIVCCFMFLDSYEPHLKLGGIC
jgi:hypothetical protein